MRWETTGPWWRRPTVWLPLLALPVLAAFPPLEWHVLGWVALAPVIYALRQTGGRSGLWLAAGWGYGILFYGGQFAWLYHAMVGIAGVPAVQFAAFAGLLVASLGLVPGLAIWLARVVWRRWGFEPALGLPLLLAGADALLGVAPFGGIAWGSLAAPQPHTVAAGLLVPRVGGAGLVLLLGLVNGGWAWAALAFTGPPGVPAASEGRRPTFWQGPAGRGLQRTAVMLALTVALALPRSPVGPKGPGGDFEAVLVPGDVSPATMVAQYNTPDTLRRYLGRTLEALTGDAALGGGGAPQPRVARSSPARLVIWPESAVSGEVGRGKILVELSDLANLMDVALLLGSGSRELGAEYNSVYLVPPGPFNFQRYDKRRLVPFGEYVPQGFGWLFGRKLTAGENDYTAGAAPPVLGWRGIQLGVAICFESVLPAHLRDAVRRGSEIVVAVANDSWLTPAARRQHLLLTALRGLEVGRDVLFVANRGWSGLLRHGLSLRLERWGGEPFPVRARLRRTLTPWVRWGYSLLALLAAGVFALGLALCRRPPRESHPLPFVGP